MCVRYDANTSLKPNVCVCVYTHSSYYLDPVLLDAQSAGHLLTQEHIWVLGLCKHKLELVQLIVTVRCSSSLGLLWLLNATATTTTGVAAEFSIAILPTTFFLLLLLLPTHLFIMLASNSRVVVSIT